MNPRSVIGVVVGVLLIVLGVITIVRGNSVGGVVPLVIGLALCYVGWSGHRAALIVFGHTCIVMGCFLITWGIYLLPYCKPILAHILTRPLFWGIFSIMGGICANYHGFCQCMRRS